MGFFQKLFASANTREVAGLTKRVQRITALEPVAQAMTDEQLRRKMPEFKERLAGGETLDDLLEEAFAVVREAGVRALGQRIFDVQLLGGIVLHQGRIAEMLTGEGKTISVTPPAYLNALTGRGVHIVTVNDYLAKYQSELMSKIFGLLGMSVGLIVHERTSAERQAAYACDITYGTNNEYGFDYLRDNMVVRREEMVQRELNFAIVDEVDSILVDEARTPLIISGDAQKSTEMYKQAQQFARRLREEDSEIDEKARSVVLTETGIAKAEEYFHLDNLADGDNSEINHFINNALKANRIMKRDTDYVVQDGEVIIVDEFTGRLMLGRRYSDGLHQAIEAKENVNVQRETRTLATITFQNYFRMYKKLSGMTGTAKTEEEEFQGIYALDVVQVPTNMPMVRVDSNDSIYRSIKGKYQAVVEDIAQTHQKGRPVLVGTVSVEKSELISAMLKRRGIPHQVLNAKYHDKEAEIVAQAGKVGAVTIATNMAGRGTDIMLGGNADFLARQKMRHDGYGDELIAEAVSHAETKDEEILKARGVYRTLQEEFKKQTDKEHDRVVQLGGLYIIGTERHESRRIDNQLRGRSGRQGDPGESRFYLSLEDDLLRLFGSERIQGMIENIGMDEETPLEMGLLSKQIENAQKRVESRNYQTRRHVLEYDNVMNQQREIIYAQRRSVLQGEDVRAMVYDMLKTYAEQMVDTYTGDTQDVTLWDVQGLYAHLQRVFLPRDEAVPDAHALDKMGKEGLKEALYLRGRSLHEQRMALFAERGFDVQEVERALLLRSVDRRWMDHIDAMDELRGGVSLRAYGQKDPVQEYKFEGFEMFEEMIAGIKEDLLTALFHIDLRAQAPTRTQVATPLRAGLAEERTRNAQTNRAPAAKTPVRVEKTVGRNDPCPCGSGKKFKNCTCEQYHKTAGGQA